MAGPPPLAAVDAPRRYPCKSCGAALTFRPGSNHLLCPYCGAENEIAAVGHPVAELDFRGRLADIAGAAETVEVLTIKCTGCGAETTFRPNQTAASCAFCGTALTANAQSARLIKPQALLPFKLDERQARDVFGKWLKGLWFAPNEVKRIASGPGKMTGVYVPHWTYDSSTTTQYTGQRGEWYYTTESYTTTENGKPVTRTRQVRHTAWHYASGTVHVAFDDVLVSGSNTLPEVYRPHAEVADLQALVPFTEDYLAGFSAESYAVGLEEGFNAACAQMQPMIDQSIRSDIGGDEQQISSKHTDYADVTFKLILLPLWISVFDYRGRPFRFTVDARTGKVQGERPWSKAKIALAIAAALLLILIIATIASASQ